MFLVFVLSLLAKNCQISNEWSVFFSCSTQYTIRRNNRERDERKQLLITSAFTQLWTKLQEKNALLVSLFNAKIKCDLCADTFIKTKNEIGLAIKKKIERLFGVNCVYQRNIKSNTNCFGLCCSSFELRLEGICLNDSLVEYVVSCRTYACGRTSK